MIRKHITKTQVKLYMKYRKQSKLSQEAASAKSGISVRSGRTIEKGKHYSQKPKVIRQYKTRRHALDHIWESELIPLLEANSTLQPKTLFLLFRTYTSR